MRKYLDRYELFTFAREVRWAIQRKREESKALSLTPERPARGNVLFSHSAAFKGFSLEEGRPVPNTHPNYWESMRMVATFLECGLAVDVISSDNATFVPARDYSVFVDVRRNLERLAPLLNETCVKVIHLDTPHLLVANAAELRRLLELRERKGATLYPRRMQLPNQGIEVADCATTIGNESTQSTYRYANKPIYRLPIAPSVTCQWPEDKDWEACRRRFLWFTSGGLVHKGLDLALEAFAAMPEYELTVCCPNPLQWEEDFARVYFKELYQTPNIRSLGWVDVNGREFLDLAGRCAATLLFSCSEGASTSTVNCMHAGLMPVVSHECGLDVDDFGFVLRDCSIENIKDVVRKVAALPAREIERRTRAAWEYVRADHTRERFVERYREVVEEIVGGGIKTAVASAPRRGSALGLMEK